MPNWSNLPPPPDAGTGLRLRRTPPAIPLVAIVTSDDVSGCPTHFRHGRTSPCTAPTCEACAAGHGWRWHAYLAAVDAKSNEHFVFECTAQAAENFVTYRQHYGQLRGCLFQATRVNSNPNGRVLIQTRPADLDKRSLPPAPDVTLIMAHIWNLPAPAVTTPERQRGQNRMAVDPDADPDPHGNTQPHHPQREQTHV